jgi:hypothetical protein
MLLRLLLGIFVVVNIFRLAVPELCELHTTDVSAMEEKQDWGKKHSQLLQYVGTYVQAQEMDTPITVHTAHLSKFSTGSKDI